MIYEWLCQCSSNYWEAVDGSFYCYHCERAVDGATLSREQASEIKKIRKYFLGLSNTGTLYREEIRSGPKDVWYYIETSPSIPHSKGGSFRIFRSGKKEIWAIYDECKELADRIQIIKSRASELGAKIGKEYAEIYT